jgi:lipopolysaccharide/colanic/teichoic acid biosynthesis glycosyltransferase
MMKRLLDILLSAIATLLFLPFGLPIAVVLRFTGEGEIFYVQQRIGRGGQTLRPAQVCHHAKR